MEKFQEAFPVIDKEKEEKSIRQMMTEYKKTREEAEKIIEAARKVPIFKNDKYTVHINNDEGCRLQGWPEMIHLSIKRNDRQPIHDWRELQAIKNELVGKENEACELYPAESRMVDIANQYHLWVLKDPKLKFPFGFMEGRVTGNSTNAEELGAKQRDH